MDLPKIYAHIAPDGRLLDARTEPPISRETIGGRVYDYTPVDWRVSNKEGFKPPEEGRPVVVKIFTMVNGVEVPERARYAAYLSFTVTSCIWGLWGWKYLEE